MTGRVTFVLPGPANTLTGGYLYDAHLTRELRARGWHVDVRALPAGFPAPSDYARITAAQLFAELPDGALVLVDGLALGVLPEIPAVHAARLRIVALVHHPLHLESGLSQQQAERLFASERAALSRVAAVIVTGTGTAKQMLASGLVSREPVVIEPGVEALPLREPNDAATSRLLCVATLTPRKNHALLIRALAPLRELPWELTCVGSLTMHAATTAAVRDAVAKGGLGGRVHLVGEIEPLPLRSLRLESDLAVQASAYEGYGMAVAEAIAQGVPVIATRTGACEMLVGDDAGITVPPDDEVALRDALRALLADPARREACAAAARERAARFPRWADAAERCGALLEAIAESPG